MNPLIELKKTAPRLLITLTLLCLGPLPQAQAVVPPPDGGYPGFNTAEGQKSLFSLTSGVANTAVGWYSLFSNTDGSYNTGVGAGTLLFNVGDQTTGDGTQNTAVGTAALLFNTTGNNNTAVGAAALLNNTTGNRNTAIGDLALFSNTTSGGNTATGFQALFSNTEGINNTAVGGNAGFGLTGSNNIVIGYNVFGLTGDSGTIRIGNNFQTATYIAGIYGTFNTAQSAVVYIDPDGRLGTGPSARRFKKDIADMGAASEVLLSMRPVTFHFKTQDTEKAGREISQFGLIAEEVAEVNPDLILRDKEGEIYSVRYDAVNAMLLNEFLKAHSKMEEQEATIAQLKSTDAKQEATIAKQQKQIEALTAGLQKVSDQLELSKPEPKVAVNNP
jgi:uncharacterized coiled-coil protein SlyX